MTRKNSSLSSISEKTLKTYLMRVYDAAEARVAEKLLASFGIVLDGITFNGRHFIAIFAVSNNPEMCHGDVADDSSEYYSDTDCFTRRFLLLAFCPLDVKEDLGAQSLFDLIADTFSRYNKPWKAVHYMVADNCDVNQYIGNCEGAFPMIGIIKLQRKEPLSPAERAACADFRRSDTTVPQPPPPSDLLLVQQAFKKRKVAKRSRYADVAFVPPTSNECERFFSAAKLVYSDLRKRMDASTLDMLMFLMYNKDIWDIYTVEAQLEQVEAEVKEQMMERVLVDFLRLLEDATRNQEPTNTGASNGESFATHTEFGEESTAILIEQPTKIICRLKTCQHQARATVVKAFERSLAAESTNMEHVRALIAVDPDRAGRILVTLMDKFAVDTKDAALLWLLWYLFGCASDITFVRKQQLSIGAGEMFFIRFIRVKTSDEQALSLFPDVDPATCLLLALTLALNTQESPCTALLNHLPVESKDVPGELTEYIPLLDLLDGSSTLGSSQAPSINCSTSTKPVAGIHALVNHLQDRVAGSAGIEDALTYHSFRRGATQHAIASSELTAQWIFDRGA
ncbi:hypothetical protein PHMEG_00014854 [Phytophthora megakarya]|uniref:HAT C-terminal dimerisation domain-containing protein n=1 Tax=Phytophthora megakarya TaxID=4795 RepID=A0A225W2Q7_9STRA|nr:hypothetical protein PHMEG_00014854 [Phytophthora megakarya]